MTSETSPIPAPTVPGSGAAPSGRRLLGNKVPEVTLYFWIIKVLCTTVGETAADLLNARAGLGLTGVSALMSALLAVVLVVQFRSRTYRAGVYWLAVALISVVGTLISDNLTDNLGVPLAASTSVFALVLAIVFAVWYRRERTLSIHHIDTTGRESFYWLAVLFTFALGTAAGDLVSERLALGYWLSAVLFGLAIAAVALAHFTLGLDAVWSFWIAYVLTRPLGASLGDYLSQPTGDGGLGLGTVVTSALFLAVILALVGYLTVTRKDVTPPQEVVRDAG
ncbi:COG4705 family protein [Streptomyces noursei]